MSYVAHRRHPLGAPTHGWRTGGAPRDLCLRCNGANSGGDQGQMTPPPGRSTTTPKPAKSPHHVLCPLRPSLRLLTDCTPPALDHGWYSTPPALAHGWYTSCPGSRMVQYTSCPGSRMVHLLPWLMDGTVLLLPWLTDGTPPALAHKWYTSYSGLSMVNLLSCPMDGTPPYSQAQAYFHFLPPVPALAVQSHFTECACGGPAISPVEVLRGASASGGGQKWRPAPADAPTQDGVSTFIKPAQWPQPLPRLPSEAFSGPSTALSGASLACLCKPAPCPLGSETRVLSYSTVL